MKCLQWMTHNQTDVYSHSPFIEMEKCEKKIRSHLEQQLLIQSKAWMSENDPRKWDLRFTEST